MMRIICPQALFVFPYLQSPTPSSPMFIKQLYISRTKKGAKGSIRAKKSHFPRENRVCGESGFFDHSNSQRKRSAGRREVFEKTAKTRDK
jgi:hypothetical protein